MVKRMLIDATQKEETRVAVIEDNRLEEFDYESTMRKPLKGNVFLAKVTRVEPSLQACFVSYGGNRHGFLPFSEIHPDYFRIPVADQEEFIRMQREELEEHDKLEEEIEFTQEDDAEDAATAQEANDQESASDEADVLDEDEDEVEADFDADTVDESNDDEEDAEADADVEVDADSDTDSDADTDAEESGDKRDNARRGRGRYGRGRGRGGRRSNFRSRRPENFGDDEAGQAQRFRFNLRRKYKIQEVIKRGQIMLIQVSREERGNKGAAVTTYLSLPGRYCVLMPNSPRGGGVSRKISNQKDRSKMKDLLSALEVPAGMSTILRTAGVTRTKTEVKRDMDYLMRLWNSIRELTLKSTAPALIYEEADLMQRAVRDHYSREIDEIIVAGEDGHKVVKNFMKMLMPSHVKRVKLYEDTNISLFQRYQVENQIADIGETEVTLPSGGYLVINPTEALVSIDVNSGRATKERNIENTALRTNLEAAEEVARQLRLRDLGGLVVVDFIDMEDRRNNGKVERKMRDALSTDRARVQVGRISSFGLMELSRQRLNASLSEAQFEVCPHCEGRGRIRTADSASLLVLRAIEAEGVRKRAAQVIAHVPAHVALYLLNHKRALLGELEERYSLQILIRVDEALPASVYRVEVSKPINADNEETSSEDESSDVKKTDEGTQKQQASVSSQDDDEDKPKKRRSRGRRGGRNRRAKADQNEETSSEDDGVTAAGAKAEAEESDTPSEDKPKRSRRKKAEAESESKAETETEATEKPKSRSNSKAKKTAEEKTDEVADQAVQDKPKKASRAKKIKIEEGANDSAAPSKSKEENPAAEYETVNEAPKKKRRGWWNRDS